MRYERYSLFFCRVKVKNCLGVSRGTFNIPYIVYNANKHMLYITYYGRISRDLAPSPLRQVSIINAYLNYNQIWTGRRFNIFAESAENLLNVKHCRFLDSPPTCGGPGPICIHHTRRRHRYKLGKCPQPTAQAKAMAKATATALVAHTERPHEKLFDFSNIYLKLTNCTIA